MNEPWQNNMESISMSRRMFIRFRSFVESELGIKMTEAKKTMLQARLQKRVRKLGMASFEEYYDFVFSPEGSREELFNMIDTITTNKTDFFREEKHFEYLAQSVLPDIIKSMGAGIHRQALLWSAGCSTGEEPYTLAMVLSDFSLIHPNFSFAIIGTDISTQVLQKAKTGIYDHDRTDPIPMPMRKRYLLRSKDREKGLVRIVPELRALVTFKRLNFMEENFGLRRAMDIIFCRNVLIYFDRPVQEAVLQNLCRHLRPGGYMFTGHSETLSGMSLPLNQVVSTVYQKC